MRLFNFIGTLVLMMMLLSVVQAQNTDANSLRPTSSEDKHSIVQPQKSRSNLKSIEASNSEGQPEVYITKGFFFGIDYKNAEKGIRRLNCAEKDTENINTFFTKNTLYNFIPSVALTGEQVNRRNIIGELGKFKDELKNGIYPELHRVLIYFAGHGLIHDNRYYLALNSTELSMPRGESISKTEIYEEISDICKLNPDLEVFLIVDACYSGNLLFTPRIEDQRKITTMVSSEFKGVSYEDYSEGSGIYTRFFLTGVKGDASNDEMISVREAGNFAHEKVVKETKDEQRPIHSSFNQSIPIAKKSEALVSNRVKEIDSPPSYHTPSITFKLKSTTPRVKDTIPKSSRDTFGILLNQIELYRNRFIKDPFQLPDSLELQKTINNLAIIMSSEASFFRDENRLKADSFFFAGLVKISSLNKKKELLFFLKKINSSSTSPLVNSAEQDFKSTSILFPDNLGAAIFTIQCSIKKSQIDKALKEINNLISEYPNYPNNYALKALIFHIKGNQNESQLAINNFLKTIGDILKNSACINMTTQQYLTRNQHEIINLIRSYSTQSKSYKRNQEISFEEIKRGCINAPVEERIVVAVDDFSVLASDTKNQLGEELSRMLSSALQQTNCFRVLENIEISNSTKSQAFRPTEDSLLKVQMFVTGEVIEYDEGEKNDKTALSIGSDKARIKFILKIINPQTREIVFSQPVNVLGKKNSFSGISIRGAMILGGKNQNRAISNAVEQAIIEATSILIENKNSISLTAASTKISNSTEITIKKVTINQVRNIQEIFEAQSIVSYTKISTNGKNDTYKLQVNHSGFTYSLLNALLDDIENINLFLESMSDGKIVLSGK